MELNFQEQLKNIKYPQCEKPGHDDNLKNYLCLHKNCPNIFDMQCLQCIQEKSFENQHDHEINKSTFINFKKVIQTLHEYKLPNNQNNLHKQQRKLLEQSKTLKVLANEIIKISKNIENFANNIDTERYNKTVQQILHEILQNDLWQNNNCLQKTKKILNKFNKIADINQNYFNQNLNIYNIYKDECHSIYINNYEQHIKSIQKNIKQLTQVNADPKIRFKEIIQEMNQQQNVVYDNFQDFKENYKIGEVLESDDYSKTSILYYINQEDYKEDLVVKQLNCAQFNQSYQEIGILSYKKVQLLPLEYRKRILEYKNVYWDPIRENINIILPRAQYSLYEEISYKIQNKNYYSQEELCYKLSCALEGLLTLESLGIVHRDIKPSKLLIMKDGSLVISDLGQSLKLDYKFDEIEFVGTQKYWNPELIEMYQKLKDQCYYDDIQSPIAITNFKTIDLYALGICFVQAASLTQLPKFQIKQENFLEIFKKERQTWLETQFTKLRQEKKYTYDLISLLESLVQKQIYERISLHEAAQQLAQIYNQ